jgi:hypothetical protein
MIKFCHCEEEIVSDNLLMMCNKGPKGGIKRQLVIKSPVQSGYSAPGPPNQLYFTPEP